MTTVERRVLQTRMMIDHLQDRVPCRDSGGSRRRGVTRPSPCAKVDNRALEEVHISGCRWTLSRTRTLRILERSLRCILSRCKSSQSLGRAPYTLARAARSPSRRVSGVPSPSCTLSIFIYAAYNRGRYVYTVDRRTYTCAANVADVHVGWLNGCVNSLGLYSARRTIIMVWITYMTSLPKCIATIRSEGRVPLITGGIVLHLRK